MAMSFNLLALTRNYSNKTISSDRTIRSTRSFCANFTAASTSIFTIAASG
ncbi:hypothetical protein [Microcoleus sp. herbarium12]